MTITLDEDAHLLSELVMKSQMPKTILEKEGMTTIVTGSILEKTSSLVHLLEQIPCVSVQNDEITVLGRGTPLIFINGRQMRDRMELERLQPDEIKKVEVITNPGAHYNANVKSVIRITTLKPAGERFSFETKTSSMINEQKRMSWIENLRLNFRHGKWDANAQVYGAWTHRQDDKRIQQFTYLNDIWKQISDISQEFTNINSYVRLATSCTLDEYNSLGASVSYDHYAKNLGIADLREMTMCDDV